MSRRRFLLAAGALAVAPLVCAQDSRKLPALGVLSPHPRLTEEEKLRSPLLIRLGELGWIDGKTYRYVSGHAGGREAKVGELALELVRQGVDVIFANGPEAAVAAARAAGSIPVVFWGVSNPVGQGLVESLSRPGRNVTGVAWYAGPGVDAKRLELIRGIAPGAKRLAYMTVPSAYTTVGGGALPAGPSDFRDAALALGFEVREFPVAAPGDIDPAFETILAWGAQAFTAPGTTLTWRERHRIVEFANRHRLPSCFTLADFAHAGGLVAYAIALAPSLWSAAEQVDRVFRGARPAELPVIVPSKYELIVNLKTASALGLVIPHAILLRADRVIE